jgi:16S rRNA (guanine527-N7)-methyltransferase
VSRLAAYLDQLAAWNRRVNLTGARTPAERVRVLVGDVLPLADAVEPGSLLDVGSGNGSPGLVLALLRADLAVTLLEPRLRRWAFLRDVVRDLGRADIRVLRLRHDAYPGPPVRTVTVRGLALPLSALAGLVAEGGRVFFLGREPRSAEAFVRDPTTKPPLWCYRRPAG